MAELLRNTNPESYPLLVPKKEGTAMSDFRATPDVIMENLVGLHQILPSQYFDVSGGHRLTAEQRLMLALLADAINVFQQGAVSRTTRKRLLYIDAERWIMMSAQPGPHAFTFDTVCEALGINAGLLRRRLILWKHNVCRDVPTPSRATPHLRLKITPRARHLSQRRARERPAARQLVLE